MEELGVGVRNGAGTALPVDRPGVALGALGALAVAVLGLLGGPAVPAWAAETLPPEPVLVVPGAEADGEVTMQPATQAPDDRGRLTWTVANGGTVSLDLDLGIHEVVSRDGEVEIGPPRGDLPLASDELALGAGEVARVRVPVPPEADPGTVALVARGADGEVEVSGLALVGGSGGVRPRVVDSGPPGTVTVRLHAAGPALVDVAVRASAWPGVGTDEHVIEGVLVPPGGRDVPVALSGPVAGRVTVDVAVSGPEPNRASATLWWWPREVVGAGALALVLVTAVALVVVARRRRAGR